MFMTLELAQLRLLKTQIVSYRWFITRFTMVYGRSIIFIYIYSLWGFETNKQNFGSITLQIDGHHDAMHQNPDALVYPTDCHLCFGPSPCSHDLELNSIPNRRVV